MFAGPNGSGKSTLKTVLTPKLLGVYLNADEIERQLRRDRTLDFRAWGVEPAPVDAVDFFVKSSRLHAAGLSPAISSLRMEQGRLEFPNIDIHSYHAAVAVELIERCLMEQRRSFTCETVMSHPSKIELLKEAQRLGYRTYLYYVATVDPAINIMRVKNRVAMGGHDVPETSIMKRYERSLNLLLEAIRHTHRAYIWDNSNEGQAHTWLAEITNGRDLILKTDQVPNWFQQAVLEKANASNS